MSQRVSIREMWEVYALAALPADASPDQKIDLRRAYYGGIAALLFSLREFNDGVDEDEGVERLKSWQAEIDAFVALLKAGKV